MRGIGAKTAATLLEGSLTLHELPTSGRLATGRARAAAEQFELAIKWRDMIRLDAGLALSRWPTGDTSPQLPARRRSSSSSVCGDGDRFLHWIGRDGEPSRLALKVSSVKRDRADKWRFERSSAQYAGTGPHAPAAESESSRQKSSPLRDPKDLGP